MPTLLTDMTLFIFGYAIVYLLFNILKEEWGSKMFKDLSIFQQIRKILAVF